MPSALAQRQLPARRRHVLTTRLAQQHAQSALPQALGEAFHVRCLRRAEVIAGPRIVGDEVAPPAPGLFIPLLRAADVNAFYATAAAANAAYLTASDLNRDYSLAGYADA